LTNSEELKADLSWNAGNLDDKLIEIPLLVTKWSDRMQQAAYDIKKLKLEYKRIKRIWFNYYSGIPNEEGANVAPVSLDKKAIYDIYLEGEPELAEISRKIAAVEKAFGEFENAVKQLNNISFHISSYKDWQKFKNGVN